MPPLRRKSTTPKSSAAAESVFLNIPYDSAFENLYLAYIAGVSAYGLQPRAALEVRSGERRLDRIVQIIQQCNFSLHDLSRVQLDHSSPRTPRFNMPFELGLTLGLNRSFLSTPSWIVLESTPFRLKKSLTDLDGTDPCIHNGTVMGLFRELGNTFVRSYKQPSVPEMMRVYRILRTNLKVILRRAGAQDPFTARVFRDLSVLASAVVEDMIRHPQKPSQRPGN